MVRKKKENKKKKVSAKKNATTISLFGRYLHLRGEKKVEQNV